MESLGLSRTLEQKKKTGIQQEGDKENSSINN
jgi:hypothetical protein